jgi:hypothetical protein
MNNILCVLVQQQEENTKRKKENSIRAPRLQNKKYKKDTDQATISFNLAYNWFGCIL